MINFTVSPSDGGCWYCHTKTDDMLFCFEFDTYLHLECLRKRLEITPVDPETAIIAREFEKLLIPK